MTLLGTIFLHLLASLKKENLFIKKKAREVVLVMREKIKKNKKEVNKMKKQGKKVKIQMTKRRIGLVKQIFTHISKFLQV